VRFDELKRPTGILEPLFLLAYLYDANTRCRISEDFSVSLNDEITVADLLHAVRMRVHMMIASASASVPPPRLPPPPLQGRFVDPFCMDSLAPWSVAAVQRQEFGAAGAGPAFRSTQALFSVTEYPDALLENVYLVVRVNKVLEGANQRALDLYSKVCVQKKLGPGRPGGAGAEVAWSCTSL
jgi:hypothetical protein